MYIMHALLEEIFIFFHFLISFLISLCTVSKILHQNIPILLRKTRIPLEKEVTIMVACAFISFLSVDNVIILLEKITKRLVSFIIDALYHLFLAGEKENYEFSLSKGRILHWESEHTLCHICSKHLVKWKYPPCIFAVLIRIYNHDVPVSINMIYNRLPIKLPW